MRIFIEPNHQAVIGDKNLPRRVVSGPGYIFRLGNRVYGRISTLPQWLTFTSREVPTVTQIPICVQFTCNWSRNLASFTGQRLYVAASISNDNLEAMLRKNLEMVAEHYASFYRAEALVAAPGSDGEQLATIKRHRRHLAHYLLDEIRQRLSYFGLIVNTLNVNITLPARLQQEVEDLWRLQKYQGCIADLTNLKLARAFAQGQPILNLVIDKLPGQVDGSDTSELNHPLKRNGQSTRPLPGPNPAIWSN